MGISDHYDSSEKLSVRIFPNSRFPNKGQSERCSCPLAGRAVCPGGGQLQDDFLSRALI
jgi:hypothetical protein